MGKQGFGGAAPNKLKSSAKGREANFVRELCRRHGLKLVEVDALRVLLVFVIKRAPCPILLHTSERVYSMLYMNFPTTTV